MKKLTELLTRRIMMLVMLVALTVTAAEAKKIGGIVLDETGEPVPGATVREIPKLKTSSIAAVITDFQGHFTLNVANDTESIEVNFIGYKPSKVNLVSGKEHYRIVLEPNSELLDEVVVTGYQTISKERATGSFAKVDKAQLETQRITSVSDMLEGHIAGYTDGKIRGITSMKGVTTPLYVVDGFPIERTTVTYAGGGFSDQVPDINVDDIESITVLKDAAATSIYGARAANGVIVITTKKASKGKVSASASATFSITPYDRVKTYTADSRQLIAEARDWMGQNPNFTGANAQTYAENMLKNSSDLAPHQRAIYQRYAGQISESQLNSMLDNWSKQGYRWYDEADKIDKRDATSQRYNVSLSAGSDINSFVGTIAFNRDNYNSKNSYREDLNISLRNTINATKWLSVDLGASVIYTNSQTAGFDAAAPGFTVTPYMSFYNEDGSTIVSKQEDRLNNSRLNAINNYGLYNENIDPMDELGRNNTINSDLITRLYARLNFRITDWLRFSSQFQYEFGNIEEKLIQEKESYYVRNRVNNFASQNNGIVKYNLPYGDMYSHGTNKQRAYNFRNQIDFNKTFAGVHDVTAIAGMEMRHTKNNYEFQKLYGYDDQLNTWVTVDQTAIQSFSGAIFSRPWISAITDFASFRELTNRFISFYGNAAYTYDDKYTVNGSIRTDRTNLFGTAGKYQGKPIWSTGASWRIDKESFMTDLRFINLLKLRASYGIGGNIAKDTWPYMVAYYGTNTKPGIGGTQGSISSRPNPNLRWEKTTTINVGVDFALFSNRLNGSIDVYRKKGTDLLASSNGIPVEGQGYSTTTINNGEMTNKGIELNISGTLFQDRDWTWTMQGVFSYNKSKVDYVNVEAPVGFLQIDQPQAFPRVGDPFNSIYGYKYAGLDENGIPGVYYANGDIEKNNTYGMSLDDIVYLGNNVPTYSGSLSTNLRWRDFTFSALALFEGGHQLKVPYYTYDDRWHQAGDEAHTDIPRYVASENPDLYSNIDLFTKSSAAVKDADNLKIRNISITYNLPRQFCSKFYAQGLRLTAGIENVATFAKSKQIKYALGGFNKPTYNVALNLNF